MCRFSILCSMIDSVSPSFSQSLQRNFVSAHAVFVVFSRSENPTSIAQLCG